MKKKERTGSKKVGLLKNVKMEMKKVTWPNKKEVLKYSVATLVFCIVVMIFFQVLNLGLSVIKGAFN